MTLEEQFRADLQNKADFSQLGQSGNRLAWFKPRCSCIEYTRQRLADPSFAAETPVSLGTAWDEFKTRDYRRDLIDQWITPADFSEIKNPDERSSLLEETRVRCASTLAGIVATIDSAVAIKNSKWGVGGDELSAEIVAQLKSATDAYLRAWGLDDSGPKLTEKQDTFRDDKRPALKAMRHVAEKLGIRQNAAPAWLAVHRLLDYLLSGDLSVNQPPEAVKPAAKIQRPSPGSPENPVLARILFARTGSLTGERHDLFANRQTEGPASWYLDPVETGVIVFLSDFIESLQLAWTACRIVKPNAPAVRLAPNLHRCKTVDGPSAGAMAACAMFAAINETSLREYASASVALRLRPDRTLSDRKPLTFSDIEVDDVGSIKAKLNCAMTEREKSGDTTPAPPLRKVVFTKADRDIAIAMKWNRTSSGRSISVIGASTLREIYDHVRGDDKLDDVLEIYCKRQSQKWNDFRSGMDKEAQEIGIAMYVPPHYALLSQDGARLSGKMTRAQKDDEDRERREYISYEDADDNANLTQLLQDAGPRFCLEDTPGAGKTIFTRRLLGFFSSAEGRGGFGCPLGRGQRRLARQL